MIGPQDSTEKIGYATTSKKDGARMVKSATLSTQKLKKSKIEVGKDREVEGEATTEAEAQETEMITDTDQGAEEATGETNLSGTKIPITSTDRTGAVQSQKHMLTQTE